MSLSGNDDAKIKELCSFNYKGQAIWFLNAFFTKLTEDDHEKIWLFVHKFAEIDEAKKDAGNALDELNAHRFLEHFKETQTVMEMRTNLREVGAIPKTGRPKDFPLTHFLIARYKIDWHTLVNASQGDNQEEVEQAQKKLNEVQTAFEEMQRTAADSKKREIESRKAKAEQEAALAEVKAQEDAYNNKTQQLTAKSEGGGVSGMKAKNELAQHLAEDPLPLRKAKLTLEAAVKRSERAAKAAAEAAAAAEKAVVDLQVQLAEAEKFLDEVRSRGGSAQGQLWWLSRELFEKKKYMPMAKGGVAR